jgi:hypothetical protein
MPKPLNTTVADAYNGPKNNTGGMDFRAEQTVWMPGGGIFDAINGLTLPGGFQFAPNGGLAFPIGALNGAALTDGTVAFSKLTGRIYCVRDYGALGNGVHDDTVAIQACINAAAAAKGGIVFFDGGKYLISAPLQLASNIIIQGSGASQLGVFTSGTTIVQSVGNVDIFTTGTAGLLYGIAIRDLNLTYSGGLGSPTGGAAIRLANAQGAWVERVYISTCFNGIVFGVDSAAPPANPVVALWIWAHRNIVAGVVNSAFVVSGNTANLDMQDNLCFGFGGNTGPSNVMTITPLGYCDVLIFKNNDCESFGGGLVLTSTSNTLVGGIVDSYIEANIFDACGAAPCLQFSAQNLGAYSRIKCSNNWFTAGAPQAVLLQANTGSSIVDITFRGNLFSSGGSYGMIITGNSVTPPSDVEITDNQFYGCSAAGGGALIIASGTRHHVRCNMMSTRAGAPNNFGGINISGAAVSAYILEHNDVRNCASYGISISSTQAGIARNNPGYNPVGVAGGAPGMPASGGTQGNPYPEDAMVYVAAGLATGVTVAVNGYGGSASAVSVPTGAVLGFPCPVGGSLTVVYVGGPPTWTWTLN